VPQPVLAFPRRDLDRDFLGCLPAGADPMTTRQESKTRDIVTYLVGYGLALGLTLISFAAVRWQYLSAKITLIIVLGLALIQALVHFRCFLHISLRRSARDDLLLLLFSALIVILMVSGTWVLLLNLRMRMM
jgi:cytochrome o ubiquinol oxidase operon protein cyoD